MKKSLIFTPLYFIIGLITAHAQATEPTANPTNMQFAAIKTYSLIASFTASSADGFLVVKSENPITFVPVDGTAYQKGEGVTGGGKVISVGTPVALNVREVLENSTYYFAVFAYNGAGTNINYKETAPLQGSVTTPLADPGSYYSGIDASSPTFIDDLTALIYSHTVVNYLDYKLNIIPAIFERDTVGGQVVINCEYSGETTVYTPPFNFPSLNYNREHSLPKSWMPTGGNTANADGADYHNLLLTRDIPNNYRSNHPLGNVTTVTQTYGLSKLGNNSNGSPVFEPQPARKGDDARDMFYQMICYNNYNSSGNWGFDNLLTEAPNQDEPLMKQWNTQDPPDKFERTRNDYIYSLQHNRNPFIDHPEWADCINFNTLVKQGVCITINSIETDEATGLGVKLYPNPTNNQLHIDIESTNNSTVQYTVYDLAGRNLINGTNDMNIGNNTITINVNGLQTGQYIVKLMVDGKSAYRKFLIIY
jgi:hypothetical protein